MKSSSRASIEPPTVLQETGRVAAVAVRCVDGASREGRDVGPYLPVLLELMRHPEERVRGPAQWTLAPEATALRSKVSR